MNALNIRSAWVLGLTLALGLSVLGYQLAGAAIKVKQYERSVTVKGLAERDVIADIVLWPIEFAAAGNQLEELYELMEQHSAKIKAFLIKNGVAPEEITVASPSITDKLAQQWSGAERAEFRYTATQTITLYSKNVEAVRAVMGQLSELGRQGIVFTGDSYQSQTEYIYTGLNQIKPDMIEEATRNAREVGEKFAKDSESKLGKIKQASQGQFSVQERDRSNPHIKKVRVVSTVEYYLSD
ncbi:MAG TPA: SIMPL domain-containing protein [Thiopseudomonas sp.]|nr:SIMPL domain-containing protein [Thiopseudomonas sp.]